MQSKFNLHTKVGKPFISDNNIDILLISLGTLFYFTKCQTDETHRTFAIAEEEGGGVT